MKTENIYPAAMIQEVVYRYPKCQDPALSVRAFQVQKGEQVVITGSSGTGKSTLLHLLTGLMDPDSGTIQINGQTINHLRGSKRDRFLGKHIEVIFQTFHLLHGLTVLENILAALLFSDLDRRARGSFDPVCGLWLIPALIAYRTEVLCSRGPIVWVQNGQWDRIR